MRIVLKQYDELKLHTCQAVKPSAMTASPGGGAHIARSIVYAVCSLAHATTGLRIMAASRRKQGKPASSGTGAQKPKFGQATAQNRRKGETVRLVLGAGLILYLVYLYFNGKAVRSPLGANKLGDDLRQHVNLITEDDAAGTDESEGHWDFGDGRKTTVREEFLQPKSEALRWVNVMLGNGG